MTFNRLLTLSLVFITISSCKIPGGLVELGPPEELITRYRKFIPSEEKITYKSFNQIISKLPNGQKKVRFFYPEKFQCTKELTYSSTDKSKFDGPYKEWWDDGFKKEEGQYDNGEKTGLWKRYSMDDGSLVTETNYNKGEKDGKENRYKKSMLSSSFTYKMGLLDGDFQLIDSTGVTINEGIYKADTIFQQSLEPIKDDSLEPVQIMPMFPGCEQISGNKERSSCAQRKMLMNIYSNIRYPADARSKGIEGTAMIRFVIDKDGSINNIRTVRGICESIETECLRLVSSMPKWNPGLSDNEPVKVQFTLPIKFKLQ